MCLLRRRYSIFYCQVSHRTRCDSQLVSKMIPSKLVCTFIGHWKEDWSWRPETNVGLEARGRISSCKDELQRKCVLRFIYICSTKQGTKITTIETVDELESFLNIHFFIVDLWLRHPVKKKSPFCADTIAWANNTSSLAKHPFGNVLFYCVQSELIVWHLTVSYHGEENINAFVRPGKVQGSWISWKSILFNGKCLLTAHCLPYAGFRSMLLFS